MDKIIYQGQEIEAELVNYLSGIIPTSTVDMEGDEKLYRDAHGHYYLQRKLKWLGINQEDGHGERRASGRTLTHRISVKAAILWATTRVNSETLDLRRDAAALLANVAPGFSDLDEHAAWLLRDYVKSRNVDPRDALNGALEMAFSDGGYSDREAVAEAKARRLGETKGKEIIKPGVVTRSDETDFEHLRFAYVELDSARRRLKGYLDARQREREKQEGIAPVLEEEKAKLVRRYLEATPFAFTASDIVNGCVWMGLQMAFGNQEEAERATGLASAEIDDGAWGRLQNYIGAAYNERNDQADPPLKADVRREEDENEEDDEAEIEGAVEHMRSVLGNPAPGNRRKAADPDDVALLAAAAPEAIEEEQAERNTLADLVARRDAIRKEMAEHEERQGDEWYNARVDEMNYLNRRIQAREHGEEAK